MINRYIRQIWILTNELLFFLIYISRYVLEKKTELLTSILYSSYFGNNDSNGNIDRVFLLNWLKGWVWQVIRKCHPKEKKGKRARKNRNQKVKSFDRLKRKLFCKPSKLLWCNILKSDNYKISSLDWIKKFKN